MRKRHENHVRKRVLLNGGDRTVVEQETPEKALAWLDARKPIGYRAVAVIFTLLTRLIMPIFVTFRRNWGARCCPACLQRPLPPILNFLDPCLSPDDYQRDLAMIIGVEKKMSLENAHLRIIVTVWRLSHCFSALLNAGKVAYNWFEVNAVRLNTEKEGLPFEVTLNILGNLVFLSRTAQTGLISRNCYHTTGHI